MGHKYWPKRVELEGNGVLQVTPAMAHTRSSFRVMNPLRLVLQGS